MVGILIVSHSQKIAEGVMELAAQMTQGQVPLAAAGGTGDGRLGTNAELIHAEAERLAAREGVDGLLVLLDLGSAVMSAELAFEGFATPHVLSNAPLVEGTVIAAVEASAGATLEETAAAADESRGLQKITG